MSGTVQSTQQKLFKRIVVLNKIMDETTADRLLAREPDPEKVVRYLVQQEKLKKEVGQQLLVLYRRQLQKHGGSAAGDGGAIDGAVGSGAEHGADFETLVSDALTATEAGPEAEPAAAPSGGSGSATATPAAAQAPPAGVPDDLPLLELDTDDDERTAPAPAAAPPAEPARRASPASPAQPAARSSPAAVAAKAAPRALSPLIVRILEAGRAARASDVHIKSGEVPLLRVAGALRELEDHPKLAAADVEAGLLTLLTDAQRERFLGTNDLDFCFDAGGALGRFRTNFMRQHRGMDGIFRLISAEVPSFEQLKLPPVVKKFTEYKQGIVLITGPKGCGKTTTLAAMVDLINSTRPEHIITIEDPIEFVQPCKKGHVNQREVGAHTESFSNALRAALREAPDVIMVGEMRDLETTSLAITAAETGHLVFATLHTPDAVRTIDRVLDVFPPKEQGQIRSMVSESMRGIVSQLLLPSTDGKTQELAVEVLVNTTAIGNLIREEKTFQLRGIMQTGRRLGMQLMDDSLIELAKAGRIAKDEAVAVSAEPARVRKELGIG